MADVPQRTTSSRYAILGLILVIAGAVTYPLLMDNAWIRSAALPNIILIAVGVFLVAWSLVKRRSKATIACASLGLLVGGGFFVSFYLLMNLPAHGATPEVGQLAREFSLQNQDGESVSLSDFKGKGPVLLVFYRGHW